MSPKKRERSYTAILLLLLALSWGIFQDVSLDGTKKTFVYQGF